MLKEIHKKLSLIVVGSMQNTKNEYEWKPNLS